MKASLAAPAWLERFEADFSEMLRTPLDPGSGRLRDQAGAYSPEICAAVRGELARSARQRLAVYNRQYWFRLLGVLHHEFPRTTALVGPWAVNALALRFLEHNPPRHPDLARAADGFLEFFEQQLTAAVLPLELRHPRRALLQAARVDQAFREVFRALEQPVFTPTAAEVAELDTKRLRASDAVQVIEEDWPLAQLRRGHASTLEEPASLAPSYADGTHYWALCQTDDGQRLISLSPLQARWMQLLQEHTISDALARLEQSCAPELRGQLITSLPKWLSLGLRHGFWTGLVS